MSSLTFPMVWREGNLRAEIGAEFRFGPFGEEHETERDDMSVVTVSDDDGHDIVWAKDRVQRGLAVVAILSLVVVAVSGGFWIFQGGAVPALLVFAGGFGIWGASEGMRARAKQLEDPDFAE
jgi:hypothetical protein